MDLPRHGRARNQVSLDNREHTISRYSYATPPSKVTPRTIRLVQLVWALGAMVTACAPTTPGAKPDDMSTAQHEQEAEDHARAAERHGAQFDPNPSNERIGGRARQRRWWLRECFDAEASRTGLDSDVCWTSIRNRTAAHLAAAQEHQRRAADHREASAELREAEALACTGIAPAPLSNSMQSKG